MIERCNQAGLPDPDFEERAGQFVVTLWRDLLTKQVLCALGLNQRQQKVVAFVRTNRRISNADYQRVTGVIRKTALRDLDDMVEKGLLERRGQKRGSYYVLSKKWDIYGTSG